MTDNSPMLGGMNEELTGNEPVIQPPIEVPTLQEIRNYLWFGNWDEARNHKVSRYLKYKLATENVSVLEILYPEAGLALMWRGMDRATMDFE